MTKARSHYNWSSTMMEPWRGSVEVGKAVAVGWWWRWRRRTVVVVATVMVLMMSMVPKCKLFKLWSLLFLHHLFLAPGALSKLSIILFCSSRVDSALELFELLLLLIFVTHLV